MGCPASSRLLWQKLRCLKIGPGILLVYQNRAQNRIRTVEKNVEIALGRHRYATQSWSPEKGRPVWSYQKLVCYYLNCSTFSKMNLRKHRLAFGNQSLVDDADLNDTHLLK